jgi:uncharacterized protein (DUF1697 family)
MVTARGKTGATGIHVALLRGINVGGKHSLPMKDLAAMFLDAGCREVRTYIQSGNVVFQAAPPLAQRVPGIIANAVQDRFGFEPPVVTRTLAELRDVTKRNPFLRAGVDPATLHVAFLAGAPGKAKAGALEPERFRPDAFALRGREIYLHCPNGLGRSKLTNAYFDSRLATTSTVRNWRTVLTLLELAGG